MATTTNKHELKRFQLFKSKLNDICFEHIPILSVKNYKLPWFSKELKRFKNRCSKSYNKYEVSNSTEHFKIYKRRLADFRNLDKILHNRYIRNFESNIKNNPKAFWAYIESKKSNSGIPSFVFYNDKQAKSADDTVNLFAEFFSTNFVSDTDSVPYRSDFSNSPLFFGSLSITVDDVQKPIISIKPSMQTDADGLCPILLKNCHSLSKPLALIFNKSLTSGLFLQDWKKSYVTPIFKSGNKNDVTNRVVANIRIRIRNCGTSALILTFAFALPFANINADLLRIRIFCKCTEYIWQTK
ncbi:PREDICTED: uncharacterized protein LOC108370582 [Rhagoletis zephyria]|uniref:uncharacterized protein LOC108370582 n=1 Tax=Rhagoletis zephyria TaxID=28612 RepID=UPI000811A029|nr:PREDICTED: uncharacterized protein LOC108370582 [Rhagoletis zephyria]